MRPQMARTAPEASRGWTSGTCWVRDPSCHHVLVTAARIDRPVLLMVGDRDQFITVEANAESHRELPRAELAVIPGADHGIAFSNAGLCTQIILEFLLRHAMAPVSDP